MTYVMKTEEKGVGRCAFDPTHNSSYVFSGQCQLHLQSFGLLYVIIFCLT